MNLKLYNEQIMALARDERGRGRLAGDGVYAAQADNPLCGDECTVYARLHPVHDLDNNGDRVKTALCIADLKHDTRGCALCLAAATVLTTFTENAKKTINDARALHKQLLQMLQDGQPPPPMLELFTPVTARKSRHSCVLLPFEALFNAAATAERENK